MKIAHFHSQTRYPEEQLRYGNLLGACCGGQGEARKKQHCDTYQGDRDISRSPADLEVNIEDFIEFGVGSGVISSTDAGVQRELTEILNLNMEPLVRSRREQMDRFEALVPRPWNRTDATRELVKWQNPSADGELEPYCQAVVYLIRDWLANHPEAA